MSEFIYFNYIKNGVKIIGCDDEYFMTLGLEKGDIKNGRKK